MNMFLRNLGIVSFFLLVAVAGYSQQTYYWIGGSGDFQDPSKWSNTSGGFPAGLNPNGNDNVIFDQNSFTGPGQEVTNSNNIFVNNMDWSLVTNNPTFTVDGLFEVNIEGSLTLSPNMQNEVTTAYKFVKQQQGNTITSNGNLFNCDIIFEGTGGGEWTIVDDLNTSGIIDVQEGIVRSTASLIGALGFKSDSNLDVIIDLGTTTLNLLETAVVQPSFILNGDNIDFRGDQSSIVLSSGSASFFELTGAVTYTFGEVRFQNTGKGNVVSNISPGGLEPFFDILAFEGDGMIMGNHVMNTLEVGNRHTLTLENGSIQNLEMLTAQDECNGEARIVAEDFNSPNRAILDFGRMNRAEGPFFLRGIEGISRSATINLVNGFDGGNNSRIFNFGGSVGRDYFWIGPGTDWSDPNNWSETSGGPPAACIPRAVDNVYFDDNSFTTTSANPAQVISPNEIFVNSFHFTYTGTAVVIIDIPTLNVLASRQLSSAPSGMFISEPFTLVSDVVNFISVDKGGSSAATDILTIDVTPNFVFGVPINLTGEVDSRIFLNNDLNSNTIINIEGDGMINFNGFDVTAETMVVTPSDQTNISLELNADGSTVTITGLTNGPDQPLIIAELSNLSGIGAQWIFTGTNTGFDVHSGNMGNILFEDPTGQAQLISRGDLAINQLTIRGNGEFSNQIFTIDSLILFPGPGRLYTLGAGVDVSITEYLEGLNDQCNDLNIATNGTDEAFNLAAGIDIAMTYVEIERVSANGGGTYVLGEGSEDLGGANGWTFPTAVENEENRNFLGVNNIEQCNDQIVDFSTDPTRIQNVQWFVNRTLASTGQDYTLSGLPLIQEIIALGETATGCPVSDTIMVQFFDQFTIELGAPDDVCQGDRLTLDPGFSDPQATYEWSTNETTETISVNTTDNYRVTVTRGGCVETDEVAITRIDLPAFGFPEDTIRFCSGDTRVIDAPNLAGTGASFTWNDGTSTNLLELSETTLPTDSIYWLEVTEGSCTDRDSLRVTYDARITDVITMALLDTTICSGESFSFQTVPGFDSLIWNDDSRLPSLNVNSAGRYEVNAFRGACRALDTRTVTVTEIENFVLDGPFLQCESDALRIPKPATLTLTTEWLDIQGNSITTLDTLDVPQVVGTAEYILEATEGLCSRRDTTMVTFEAAPIVDVALDTTICQGESITRTLPSDVDFDWSNGNTDRSISINSTDTVSVISTRGTCTVFDTIRVNVLDLTSVDVGPRDLSICDGLSTELDATLPGNVNYQWMTIGNTVVINNPNDPIINVNRAGEYFVEVSATGCTASDTITISVDAPAVFDLHQMPTRQDSTICAQDTLLYDRFNIPNAIYSWKDFNEDELSDQSNFPIVNAGDYILEVTTGACMVRDTIRVAIQDLPSFAIQETDIACDGEEIILDATVGAATYQWQGPNGANAITDPQLTATQSGEYIVTVTEFGCAAMDTSNLTFNPLPIVNLINDESICDGDSVALSLQTSDTFEWETPEGNSSLSDINAKVAGDYVALVTSTENCTATDTFTLMVNPTPFFTLPDSTSLCDGMETTLTINPAGANPMPRWFNGDGNLSIPIRTTDVGQVYVDVTLTTNGEVCMWSDTSFVVVRPTPTVDLGTNANVICSDSLLVLDAGIPNAMYRWSNGETTQTIEVNQQGNYQVVVDLQGCLDSAQTNVSTIQAPEVSIGSDTTICEGDMITLSINDPSWNAVWSTGETGPSIVVPGGATYSVNVEDNGCFDEAARRIDAAPIPVFTLGDDFAVCGQVGSTLTVDLPADITVEWSTGQIGSSIQVTEPDTYIATAISTDMCEFEDEIDISLRDCQRFSIYTPNTFSPTLATDEGNSTFTVTPSTSATINTYSIEIFNRWGNRVFTSNDPTEGWDGSFNQTNGDKAGPGVYVYVITVNYSDDFDANRTDIIRGDVTLID